MKPAGTLADQIFRQDGRRRPLPVASCFDLSLGMGIFLECFFISGVWRGMPGHSTQFNSKTPHQIHTFFSSIAQQTP
ncbi:MAG TPA: hypothetical protein VMS21_09280, partial [Methylomirabilota bacterium]|nr:hypothetical protein [Methylomirabilota bacterium]